MIQRWTLFISAAPVIPIGIITYFTPVPMQTSFVRLYQEHLRSDLFNGSLSLSAFLLTMSAFTIVTMREHVYATPEYAAKLERRHPAGDSASAHSLLAGGRNGPLRRLTTFLLVTISLSLTSAVLQVTVGLWWNWYAALICTIIAALSLTALGSSVWLLGTNLRSLFRFWDEQDSRPSGGCGP